MVECRPLNQFLPALVRPEAARQTSPPRIDHVVIVLVAICALALVAGDVFQRWLTPNGNDLLDIDRDPNITSWFHGVVLSGAAFAALGIALSYFDNRRRLLWLGAAVALLFFSMDRSIALHSRVGTETAEMLGVDKAAARVIWQMIWAPLILASTAVIVACIWNAPRSTKLWIAAAVVLCGTKLVLEAVTYPLWHYDIASEDSVLYGIEVNIEETVQVLGFGAVLAAMGQLFFDRISALAHGETEPLHERIAVSAETTATPQPGVTGV